MRMWCRNCNKPVEVNTYEELEHGRVFYSETTCCECGDDDLCDIKICPCGNEMAEGEFFCNECLDDLNQTLTDFRDDHKLSQDELEEIIKLHFCW